MAVDLNTFISRFWNSRLPQISGGGGSASGVLTVSTTSAATIADTNETDLWTYSLPANTLGADGRLVRITAFGSYGATANSKIVRVRFGATSLGGATISGNATHWNVTALVYRTGAGAQLGNCVYIANGGALDPSLTTPAETETGAITIKVTGQNGTAAANDIVFKGAMVEILN